MFRTVDDSCVMDFSEVTPLGNDGKYSEASNVQFFLSHIKVCVYFIL